VGVVVRVFMFHISCKLICKTNCSLLYIVMCVVVGYFCCYVGVLSYLIVEGVVSE
jgi:hypothetical protein